MHLGFVLIPYQRYTGAGEYYQHLIKAILRLDTANKYTIFFQKGADTAVFKDCKNVSCVYTPIHWGPGALRYLETITTGFFNSYKPSVDVLHCFNFPLPNLYKGKIVFTAYDLREEDLPESYGRIHRLAMMFLAPRGLKRADHIITISKFTQERLEINYPLCRGKSTAIYLAADPSEVIPQSAGMQALHRRPYLFAIGQIAPHKNIANLILAFNILVKRGCDYDLVIAGHNYRSPEFVEKLQGLAVDKNRVIFTGRISNQDKMAFLKHAKLFVFPSLYEGFGIPILEAFTLQTPQAVSRIPVFEELFGFPEAMFDPKSPEEIANVIERICTNQPLRNGIVSYGIKKLEEFTWEKTARATLSIYDNLARS